MMFYFIIIAALIIIGAVFVAIYSKKLGRKGACGSSQGKRKIYVGNLDYKVYEEELKTFFAKFGKIDEVRLIKNTRTGRSKGFAFITFSAAQDAAQALSGHGQTLKGRSLVVRIAKDK
jgi:RNA recognition motif-containing protein